MSDESARLNIHAVLLKIVALLFGLLGVLTLWRFRRLVLSGQADALIPVLWAGLLFAVAYGLWRSRRWARWFAIGVGALPLPGTALRWLTSYPERSPWDLVLAAVGIVVIVICVRRPRPHPSPAASAHATASRSPS